MSLWLQVIRRPRSSRRATGISASSNPESDSDYADWRNEDSEDKEAESDEEEGWQQLEEEHLVRGDQRLAGAIPCTVH